MIILKLAFVFFVMLFLWLILRLFLGIFRIFHLIRSGGGQRYASQQASQQSGQNTMVKCVSCGLYVLESGAIYRNGDYFCSAEHAR